IPPRLGVSPVKLLGMAPGNTQHPCVLFAAFASLRSSREIIVLNALLPGDRLQNITTASTSPPPPTSSSQTQNSAPNQSVAAPAIPPETPVPTVPHPLRPSGPHTADPASPTPKTARTPTRLLSETPSRNPSPDRAGPPAAAP